MSDILRAINNFADNYVFELVEYYKNNIRIQQAGDALEYYVKDLFCDTINIKDRNQKDIKHSEIFSYLGNANNPPDIIINGGDAIEVKKIESLKASSIALNSSFPKNKLYASDPLITKACKDCEDWKEKDIIYAIGSVNKNKLYSLWLVYGNCYAADRQIYERIKNSISDGINDIPNVEFSETKELGRVNKVDPLGVTYLRIRGMWGISHPSRVFEYIANNLDTNILNAILLDDKYYSFSKESIKNLEQNPRVVIDNVKIKNPNNPAKLLGGKHIYIKGENQ